MNSSKNSTVFVGLSGGVDSSVAAALLKYQGYKVAGIYMKNWTQDIPGFECPWKEDFNDAKRVAVHLGIDFEVFDFERQYRQKVVDYMIEEYKAGRTPNPDVMCNQEIKFKLFLDTALEKGADFIATGHYAQIERGRTSHKTGNTQQNAVSAELHVAKDKIKDQTYFLYRVSKEALSKTLFPVGELNSKEEVRKIAKKFDLPTANKKDSQGICFVGEVGIAEFLGQYVETEPGPIIDNSPAGEGKEIGKHKGAIFYTIGQRHGLEVGGGLPYYVTRKDMEANTVHVTTDLTDKDLWTKEITLEGLHWIDPAQSSKLKAQSLKVRLRYRGPLIDCQIKDDKLILKDEQRAIAAGQSAVLYENTHVLGGGIISQVS